MSGNLPYVCSMIRIRQIKRDRSDDNASVAKTARLEARVTTEQKTLIERAAAYEGRSVTDFVIHAISQAAKTVVQEHEVLRLNPAQSRAFVKRLLESPEPNARLMAAAKKYRRSVTAR